MNMAMVRLRNLTVTNHPDTKAIYDEQMIPESDVRYLAGTAMKLEMSGSMNTYVLLDLSKHNIYGYFTIGSGVECGIGKPIFEITRLFGITESIEHRLITYAMEIVRAFNDRVCPTAISVRCRREQFDVFSYMGFSYYGDVPGGFVRMRYGGFR